MLDGKLGVDIENPADGFDYAGLLVAPEDGKADGLLVPNGSSLAYLLGVVQFTLDLGSEFEIYGIEPAAYDLPGASKVDKKSNSPS